MKVPEGWRLRSLHEVTENFDGLRVPVREADRKRGAYPYYGATGIVDWVDSFIFDGEYLLIAEDGENLRSRKNPITYLAIGKFWVNNHAHIVRGNHEADTRFLMYAVSHADIGAYLTGSTMPKLTQQNLNRIPLLTPPLSEQRTIASILGTLDDKIELNGQMNETLEAIVRAIFKSWFLDFDPVRAKVEGHKPVGMDAATAALFPDSFVDSSLGKIPKGFRTASLGDLCRRVAMGPFGSDITTDNFVDAGVPVIRGGNLTHGFIDENFAYISEEKADELRNANAFPGDIVITHRGTLGQVGVIPTNSAFPRYVVSQSQLVLSADSSLATSRFLFEYLCSAEGQHQLLANTSQTGVPAIARPVTSVKAIRIILPPLNVLHLFESRVTPLVERSIQNFMESSVLARIRDTLLPKLISGEIRLNTADAKHIERQLV